MEAIKINHDGLYSLEQSMIKVNLNQIFSSNPNSKGSFWTVEAAVQNKPKAYWKRYHFLRNCKSCSFLVQSFLFSCCCCCCCCWIWTWKINGTKAQACTHHQTSCISSSVYTHLSIYMCIYLLSVYLFTYLQPSLCLSYIRSDIRIEMTVLQAKLSKGPLDQSELAEIIRKLNALRSRVIYSSKHAQKFLTISIYMNIVARRKTSWTGYHGPL